MTAHPVSDAARLRHDLRTSVNHLLGYGALLLEDAEADGREARAAALRALLEAVRATQPLLDAPGAALLAATAHVEALLSGLAASAGEAERIDLARMAGAAAVLTHFARHGGLPGETPEPITPAASPTPAAGAGAGRILVVDDEPANRELLGRRLTREGYHVETVPDGQAALARLAAGDVDVILLDVLMPGLDGDEVLRRLKADAATRDVPVLMISALSEQDAVVRCIAAGAEDYLPKEVDPVLLRARIGACLRKKRVRDEELAYLRDVHRLIAAAESLQSGAFDGAGLDDVGQRADALGTLARVFGGMASEVRAREQRLAAQVAQLRIEIDQAKKARAVAEIVETDYFQDLQRRAAALRRSPGPY